MSTAQSSSGILSGEGCIEEFTTNDGPVVPLGNSVAGGEKLVVMSMGIRPGPSLFGI